MRPFSLLLFYITFLSISAMAQVETYPPNQSFMEGFFKQEASFLSSAPNIGIEAGVISLSTSVNETDFIRGGVAGFQNYQGYYEYSSAATILSSTSRTFFGIRAGMPLTRSISFSGGLRFVRTLSSSGSEIYNDYNSNYFYWRLKSEGLFTDYLRIEEFVQKAAYLAIPVEFKIYLLESRPGFDWYFKAGSEINLLVSERKEIDFFDDEMRVYESDLIDMVGDPRTFNMTLYTAGGVNVSTKRGIVFGLELTMPLAMLFEEEEALLNPSMGMGAKIDLSIPLKLLTND